MHPTPSAVPARRTRRDGAVHAAAQGLLDGLETPVAAFVDLAGIGESAQALHAAWPSEVEVLHAFAAKANPLVPVLAQLRRHGMACEVSSPGELAQARAAGFTPDGIVLDSPVKTLAELASALAGGIAVNIDNFEELERVDGLIGLAAAVPRIGIRINPQVGLGSIEAMSTAGRTTKFGIALQDPGHRERLLDAYRARPWLRWVHVHVGSQGIPLELNAAGVAVAVEFAQEVNRQRPGQVVGIDIGGGLPVDFTDDADSPTFADHVAVLKQLVPDLFDGSFRIVTEYGRALMAKNGFVASRVEYTKTSGGRRIALTHVGAQVAARTTFDPQRWPLRVLVYDGDGRPSGADQEVQDVAGPCCFAGDLLAKERLLPRLSPGDLVVVPDTGAYYFSSPFHYNSLPMPPVYGFEADGDGEVRFTLLRAAETIDDVVSRSGVAPLPSPVAAR
ncbi:L-glutamyl-[BtrI acyl-carrier protein] decarboxylase [Streptomyces sp. RB17]|uniref:diaminopimelate decarboxylase n=1 Tax=Streptomyces sp. RB17 TaxID=2585197 RepID=UPI0012981BD0|nr:diaminopimelate decarboxylase [Streptomyces sp. RB17]MQY37224.1 L-glutamyl-[BtrI acyl-carrier protein] decarboxylase [Streptomyces sp. RB17]